MFFLYISFYRFNAIIFGDIEMIFKKNIQKSGSNEITGAHVSNTLSEKRIRKKK
jgi:hypothetical protein